MTKINRILTTPYARRKFRAEYVGRKLDTEVTSNLKSCQYEPNNKDLQDFTHKFMNNPLVSFMVIGTSLDMCKDLYNTPDFVYTGNRTYRNWVFEFEGLLFIGPSKFEVVIPETGITSEVLSKVARFEKAWIAKVLDWIIEKKPEIYKLKEILELANTLKKNDQTWDSLWEQDTELSNSPSM